MSVLIKGMEMPTSCDDCEFCEHAISGYDWCSIPMVNGRSKPLVEPVFKPDWCPIVPVPPHGRLIDADELAKRFNDAIDRAEKDKTDYCNAFMYHGDLCTEWWCVNGMLEKTPTIIPAEGKED